MSKIVTLRTNTITLTKGACIGIAERERERDISIDSIASFLSCVSAGRNGGQLLWVVGHLPLLLAFSPPTHPSQAVPSIGRITSQARWIVGIGVPKVMLALQPIKVPPPLSSYVGSISGVCTGRGKKQLTLEWTAEFCNLKKSAVLKNWEKCFWHTQKLSRIEILFSIHQ